LWKAQEQKTIKWEKKGDIELTSHSPGEFISTVFLRPKKTRGHRMILNLSDLNLTVEYNHFKIERLEASDIVIVNEFNKKPKNTISYCVMNTD
jgi:hypothetical protein